MGIPFFPTIMFCVAGTSAHDKTFCPVAPFLVRTFWVGGVGPGVSFGCDIFEIWIWDMWAFGRQFSGFVFGGRLEDHTSWAIALPNVIETLIPTVTQVVRSFIILMNRFFRIPELISWLQVTKFRRHFIFHRQWGLWPWAFCPMPDADFRTFAEFFALHNPVICSNNEWLIITTAG